MNSTYLSHVSYITKTYVQPSIAGKPRTEHISCENIVFTPRFSSKIRQMLCTTTNLAEYFPSECDGCCIKFCFNWTHEHTYIQMYAIFFGWHSHLLISTYRSTVLPEEYNRKEKNQRLRNTQQKQLTQQHTLTLTIACIHIHRRARF